MVAQKKLPPPPLARTPWYRETYEVKVWQWIGVLTSLVLIFFTTVIGMTVYLGDRDDAYEADQERECHVSVGARDDLRGVITGIYDVLEVEGTNPTVQQLRVALDQNYPPLTFEQCMDQRFGEE